MITKKTILFYGTHEECLEWKKYNPKRHDILKDNEQGAVCSDYCIINKSVDRTIRKPITRICRTPYRHYRRPIVVTFKPGDMLEMRLKGRRMRYSEPLDEIFGWMAQREALRAIARKRAAKAAKKKARAAK
jgi:hypothetical protein